MNSCDPTIEAEVMKVLDKWQRHSANGTWKSGERTYHFPHYRLGVASGEMRFCLNRAHRTRAHSNVLKREGGIIASGHDGKSSMLLTQSARGRSIYEMPKRPYPHRKL